MLIDDNDQGITPEIQEVEGQQPEPTPSSNENQTEEASQVDEEQIALENSKNPERTKSYIEKLKAELAEAKAVATAKHVDTTEYGTSVFDTLRPSQEASQPQNYEYLNQNQIDSITQQFIDQDGTVDVNGLNKALADSNNRAQQADMRAQRAEERIARFEETQQVREAHAVHPWLDPKNPEFDANKFNLVRDRILRVQYLEGKPITLLDAANDVLKATGGASPVNLDKVKNEAVAQYKEQQASRNQGPIEAGRGETRQPTQTLQEQRERTRTENVLIHAPTLEERLRNVGVIKDKT